MRYAAPMPDNEDTEEVFEVESGGQREHIMEKRLLFCVMFIDS